MVITITRSNVFTNLFSTKVKAEFPFLRHAEKRWLAQRSCCSKDRKQVENARSVIYGEIARGLQTMGTENKAKLKKVLNVNNIDIIMFSGANPVSRVSL